mmetsp:Transcript_41964/g.96332  ORF Transcript_41964/g.96332 Transcript_41964/m.96332 type:complete len:224 (+) Transcript_41964:368-1039(+)
MKSLATRLERFLSARYLNLGLAMSFFFVASKTAYISAASLWVFVNLLFTSYLRRPGSRCCRATQSPGPRSLMNCARIASSRLDQGLAGNVTCRAPNMHFHSSASWCCRTQSSYQRLRHLMVDFPTCRATACQAGTEPRVQSALTAKFSKRTSEGNHSVQSAGWCSFWCSASASCVCDSLSPMRAPTTPKRPEREQICSASRRTASLRVCGSASLPPSAGFRHC